MKINDLLSNRPTPEHGLAKYYHTCDRNSNIRLDGDVAVHSSSAIIIFRHRLVGRVLPFQPPSMIPVLKKNNDWLAVSVAKSDDRTSAVLRSN